METKFTKGPWIKYKRNEDLKGSDGYSAVVWGSGLCNGVRSPERDANAYLIAAAPDMYALLLEFKEFAERQGWEHTLINDAEKLLSKARGES